MNHIDQINYNVLCKVSGVKLFLRDAFKTLTVLHANVEVKNFSIENFQLGFKSNLIWLAWVQQSCYNLWW